MHLVLLQVKENETEEERRARLEMEALQADENERREQVLQVANQNELTACGRSNNLTHPNDNVHVDDRKLHAWH